jgi:S-DNA-T family DNA segregation ATPase FtsK/SpoIIIE
MSTVSNHAPINAVATPVEYMEIQRAAVRAIEALSAETIAPIKRRIEDEFRAAAAVAERDLTEITETAEATKRERLERLARRHAERLTQIDAETAPALSTLQKLVEREQAEALAEHADAKRRATRRRDEDVLMVDTVSDATLRGLRDEKAGAERAASAERRRLDGVLRQAHGVLAQHGCALPDDAAAVPTCEQSASVAGVARNPETLTAPVADPEAHLAGLAALPPARLAGSTVFWLFTLNLIPVAVGLSALLPSPWSVQLAGGGAIGLVITFVTAIIVARALRGRALERLRSAALAEYNALRTALTSARDAVDEQLKLAEQRFRAESAKSTAARARDANAIAAEFNTRTAQAELRRTELCQAAQARLAREQEQIQRRNDEAKRQAADDEQRRRQEIEARYADEVARAQQAHAQTLADLRPRQEAASAELESSWPEHLAALRRLKEQTVRLSSATALMWNNGFEPDWQPPREPADLLRIGAWRLDLDRLDPTVRERADILGTQPGAIDVPVLLDLPPRGALLLQTAHDGRQEAITTLRATMLRLLTSLPPERVRFTILDPIGLGQSFAGFMHLADYAEALVGGRIWTEREQIDARLSELTAHMETVIQKYLRNEFDTIDDYNAQAGNLAEPYRFLVIADFPAKFNEDSLRRLRSIMESGPRCGVFTLIAHDLTLPVPADLHLERLAEGGLHLIRRQNGFAYADKRLWPFPLQLDQPPADEVLTRIMHTVGSTARDRLRIELPFEAILPPEQQLWSGSAASEVNVPLGHAGAIRLQHLRLGRGLSQHVLIAGKTGSGKSNLLHVLITNLALWYGPDEIEMYLVDFKEGVEFKAYETHPIPHIRAIAIESDREFGISVLQRLDAELGRRGDLFRAAGVQDLAAYRALNIAPLPRTLLVVDEFQVFFTEDDRLSQEAGVLLDRLVRQGRAFGIHILLGSQTLGGSSGLGRSTMGQMAVRIALQCSDADSQLILDDTNTAARLLSRAGEAIYNDSNGRIEGNSPFQVAWLPDDVRNRQLDRVGALALPRGVGREAPVVFEGSAPAHVERNRLLNALLSAPTWPANAGSQTGAPRTWLGEAVAIKDPTAAVFKRQSGANLLIVSQRDDAAGALLCSSMLSLAAQLPPERARFVILDPRPADSAIGSLHALAAILPHSIDFVAIHDVPARLAELVDELQRRLAGDMSGGTSGAPAGAGIKGAGSDVYLFVVGLQRYRLLRKQEDSYSFSRSSDETTTTPDKHFAAILREGPPNGIHVFAWADTLATLERTFDRATLGEFDWRVLFQMSAADSSNLIDTPEANRLGLYRALLFSEEQGLLEKFRPYAAINQATLDAARAALARRKP